MLKTNRIVIILFLFLGGVFLLLGGRCLYLQLVRNDHYVSASVTQYLTQYVQKPQRGVILDRRGRVLAASDKVQNIFAEPRIIKEPKEVSSELAPVLGIGAHEICRLITESKNPGYVKLKSDVGREECEAARKIHIGIGVENNWRRNYPMGGLAGHVVGFTGRDDSGLEGIELKYDKKLSGSAGRNKFFTDIRRRPVRIKEQGSVLADGVGLILTLDATIQQFARTELLKQYESYEAESAVAIVAEPKTGAILAMVSLPDFEPNQPRPSDLSNYRNRAITDQFEPGSIMKPIVMAIALDSGVIDANEKIFCENGNYRGKGFGRITEYRGHQYGDLSPREILIKSSNIGMAKIGQKLGKDRLYRGMRLFGFGKRTGVDLPGEVAGLLWDKGKWTGYSVTRIPYGQELTVSPIQMVRAFCVLANGGFAVRPYMVQAMVGKEGEIINVKRAKHPHVGLIVKPEVARWIVNNALVGVVNEGTGRRAKLKKWQVFGKTGTANVAKSNEKGYSETDFIASFVAGAPAEDPAVVVLVSIRKPNVKLGKGYTGGVVASPVAGAIIEKTLNYLEK